MATSSRLQVGIDIGRRKADYALLHPDGQPLETHRSFINSLDGFLKAKQLLLQTLEQQQFSGLDIAVEATSYYWLPLYQQLFVDPDLARFQPRLALLNAGWVKWFKKSFPPDHKSDQRDPFYIAERLRTLPQPSWWSYDAHWLDLRFRTRLRFHLTQSLVREKNHYQLFLFLAFSGYSRLKPFSDVFGQLSQRLLSQPQQLQDWSSLSVEALAEQLILLGEHRPSHPLDLAARLQQALRESYPLPDDIHPSIYSAIQLLGETVQFLEGQIKQVNIGIASLLKEHDYPQVAWLDSIPGLGEVFSSAIAAEIGDLARFTQQPKWDRRQLRYRPRTGREVEDAVAKYAGLWWPENASGQFAAEERPLSKRGNAYLRYYVLQAADAMRLYIPSYARFYRQKYAQATKHQHKRALVLTGRKALGLFVGLLRHQECYRPEEGSSSFRA